MKKTAVGIILAFILLTAMCGLIGSAYANPYSHILWANGGDVDPRPDTNPPKINLLTKEQNVTADNLQVSVGFNVEVGESKSADQQSLKIDSVYYKADWLESNIDIYRYSPDPQKPSETIAKFNSTLSLNGVPEGNHSIIIYAKEKGVYYEPPMSQVPMWSLNTTVTYYNFEITGVRYVSFNISKPLTITLLPIANASTTDIPLNFSTSKPPSKLWYSLDGGNNVTVTGNTTLTGLQVGFHNITIHALDDAGNSVSSQTVAFTVAESNPFPITIVLVAVSILIVIAVVGLLVYRLRHKQLANQER